MTALNVAGRVRLDLSRTEYEKAGRLLKALTFAPAGAEVVLVVAHSQAWPWDGGSYLREYGGHLGRITVECSDPATVKTWVDALREGN